MRLAKLLNAILGWNFHGCILVSGVIVLAYIFMGGLTSAIYNEVLQFFLIVFGFLPLVLLGLKDVGGWTAWWPNWSSQPSTRDSPRHLDPFVVPHGSAATNPMEWNGSVWPWGSDSFLPSAIGAPTFSSCNGRWLPRTWARPGGRRFSRRCPRCSSRARDPARPSSPSLCTRGRQLSSSVEERRADYDMWFHHAGHYFHRHARLAAFTALMAFVQWPAWPAM